MWIMVIAAIIFVVAIVGICVYAYYYNNVWHPPFKLPDDLSEARVKSYAKQRELQRITWVNPEGITKSIYLSDLGINYSYGRVAFEQKRCLICDSQDEIIAVVPEGHDRRHPLLSCPACEKFFRQAANAEFHDGQRVFPGHDIDDIKDPYRTWRQYAYILRQMDDGALTVEEGQGKITELLDKQSKTAEPARQAAAQAAAAQAIATQRAAAEEHLRRLAERAKR